jgi:hypothetical protein
MHVQVINPTVCVPEDHSLKPFYMFEGTALLTIAASFFDRLTREDTKLLQTISRSTEFPYRLGNGMSQQNKKHTININVQVSCVSRFKPPLRRQILYMMCAHYVHQLYGSI